MTNRKDFLGSQRLGGDLSCEKPAMWGVLGQVARLGEQLVFLPWGGTR